MVRNEHLSLYYELLYLNDLCNIYNFHLLCDITIMYCLLATIWITMDTASDIATVGQILLII